MTYGTVHGVVSTTPGDPSNFELLAQSVVATSTEANIFLNDFVDRWRNLIVVFNNIEKPSNPGFSFLGIVSTNGATFESGNGYTYNFQLQSATSALLSTGVAGPTATALVLGITAVSPWALATATGKGGGKLTVFFEDMDATGRGKLRWTWDYINSASSPVFGQGNGYFASGPIRGFSLYNTVQTFSANIQVFGSVRK